MRKIIDMQMEFWKKDLTEIEFDLNSRDEIPKLLLGLQHIVKTPELRSAVFEILKQIVPRKNRESGRPGMTIWKILVLGTLRLNCNWDYDKVHEMANNHRKIRAMMQHSKDDEAEYGLQTIRDNVALLTPEILDAINQLVVRAGHEFIAYKKDDFLRGSCDSFVVETDVHYPTDTNLLFDAMRKAITLIALFCSSIEITDWRQHAHHIKKIKSMLRTIQRLRHSTSKKSEKRLERAELIIAEHQKYIETCQELSERVQETINILREIKPLCPIQNSRLSDIEGYLKHAERQIDQIYRRVVLKTKIPHSEKVFSIFEPYTEWISKGKAGVPQELGLRVSVLKDQYGFILHHQVMEKVTDEKIAVQMVQDTKRKFPSLSACSFDKGYYTSDNRRILNEILDHLVMPKKGKLSGPDKALESSSEFVMARKKHSAVESSIHALENHGLDRCLDHGLHGFKRYVALSVLARNIQILGNLIQQKELKRLKGQRAA